MDKRVRITDTFSDENMIGLEGTVIGFEEACPPFHSADYYEIKLDNPPNYIKRIGACYLIREEFEYVD